MLKEKPNGIIKIMYYVTFTVIALFVIAIVGRLILNGVISSKATTNMSFVEIATLLNGMSGWIRLFNVIYIIGIALSILLLIISLFVKSDYEIDVKYNKRVTIINLVTIIIVAIIMMISG